MKKILYRLCWIIMGMVLFTWFSWVYADEAGTTEGGQWLQEKTQGKTCKWIKLNTNFPLIWNCIGTTSDWVNPTNAFPVMVTALTKIVMSVILVVCLILIIVWWIFIASDEKLGKWKELIKKVAIVIVLLWFSSVILKLINPNFFGTPTP